LTGKIYLIPVHLGADNYKDVIPENVLSITRSLRIFIVENLRSARRYLRLIDKDFPIDNTRFLELDKHKTEAELIHYLEPVIDGNDAGIMSEAGLPGIADPGTGIVFMAHKIGITVIPLAGPSSIIMALIASGLNGQNFSFHGYLPVDSSDLSSKLKDLEKKASEGAAQIFMETPYRCQRMLETIIKTCRDRTLLSIAADISHNSEFIKTLTISEWKKNVPSVNNRLVIFILQ